MVMARIGLCCMFAVCACGAIAATDATGDGAVTDAQPRLPAHDGAGDIRHMTAEEVIARNVAARGGLDAWRRVKSMQMSGKMDVGRTRKAELPTSISRGPRHKELEPPKSEQADGDVVRAPFVLQLQRPRKVRLELQVAGSTALQVYDGKQGWKVRPYLNRNDVEPFTTAELAAASHQQELDGFLIDSAAKGNKVAFGGVETVDGTKAYKLNVTLKSGDARHVWVDARSFLKLKVDAPARTLNGRAHEVATYLRDYRKVAGLMIPFLLETRVERSNDTERISIEQVAVNPPLNETRFSKPL
jgi:hypothetical protein